MPKWSPARCLLVLGVVACHTAEVDDDTDDDTDVAAQIDTDVEDTAPDASVLQFDVASLTVEAGESVNLSVSWSGAAPADPALVWLADCGHVMGLTGRGSYVAPDAAASCVVTATSVAEPTIAATLPITVTLPTGGGAVRWTRHLASNLDDSVRHLAATPDGGLVALVETWGDLGGPALGDLDVVVVRLDADGAIVWTTRLATPTREFAGNITVGPDGLIWAVGSTYGALDGVSAGGSDVWVAALDDAQDGLVVSLRQFGTDLTDTATGVTVSPAGEVVVAGWTEGSLGGASAGGPDGFVRRYDAAGDVAWTRQFGGAGIDFVIGVTLDGDEPVAVGTTDGVVGASSAGGMDWYVARLSADGVDATLAQHGVATDDRAYGVAARPGGGVVVIGALGGDAFIDAFDASDGLVWSYALDTPADELGQAVAVDADGGVFAVGSSTGDVGTPNVGFFDAFVLRLDASGALVWSRRIGSAADDYGWALARLADGDVVVGGRTDGVLADGFGWGGDGYLRRLGP